MEWTGQVGTRSSHSPRAARAAAGGEGAGLEPGEAQPPSDSSRGSRPPPRATPSAPHRSPPGPILPEAALRPPRPPRGSRREGDRGQRQEGSNLSLLSHHGRCYSLARARTRTSWKAPGWTYLTLVRWGHRLLHRPTGTAYRPVRRTRPSACVCLSGSCRIHPPPAPPTKSRCLCGRFPLRHTSACALPGRRVCWEL